MSFKSQGAVPGARPAPNAAFAQTIARYKAKIEESEQSLARIETDVGEIRRGIKATFSTASSALGRAGQVSAILAAGIGAVMPALDDMGQGRAAEERREVLSNIELVQTALSCSAQYGELLDAGAEALLQKSESWKELFPALKLSLARLEAEAGRAEISPESRKSALAGLETGYSLLEQGICRLKADAEEFCRATLESCKDTVRAAAKIQDALANAARMLQSPFQPGPAQQKPQPEPDSETPPTRQSGSGGDPRKN